MNLFQRFREFLKPAVEKPIDRGSAVDQILEELYAQSEVPALTFQLGNEPVGLYDSKVGGLPYLPPHMKWPHDENGAPLFLLAQINCADLQELPEFPHRGILQFYVRGDSNYGLYKRYPTHQSGFRVIFHYLMQRTVTEAEIVAKMPELDEQVEFPVQGSYKMHFTLTQDRITLSDYRMEQHFVQAYNEIFPKAPIYTVYDLYHLDPELYERLHDDDTSDHQIGGYPYFNDVDPRGPRRELRSFDTLLFQLDSDSLSCEQRVKWGDYGIGQFFMNKRDLKERDFSNVLYHWDNG